MTNPLIDIFPDVTRKYLYAIYAFVGVVLGAAQIMGASWAAEALAVYAFVGTAFGLTASSNVKTETDPDTEEFVDTPDMGETPEV